jgi:hypothetical protein
LPTEVADGIRKLGRISPMYNVKITGGGQGAVCGWVLPDTEAGPYRGGAGDAAGGPDAISARMLQAEALVRELAEMRVKALPNGSERFGARDGEPTI